VRVFSVRLSSLHSHPEPGASIRVATAAVRVGLFKGHFSKPPHVAETLEPGQAVVTTRLLLAKTLDSFAKVRVTNGHISPYPAKAAANGAWRLSRLRLDGQRLSAGVRTVERTLLL
jgi:hypothetical protein